jgi:hypothetical protein
VFDNVEHRGGYFEIKIAKYLIPYHLPKSVIQMPLFDTALQQITRMISNFRRVLNAVCFLLVDSPESVV